MAIDQVTTGLIKDDAVTTAKILDDNVTAAKIPAGAVVADVGTGGIATANLADDAVTQPKIGADAVTVTELADDAVVNASVAAGAAIALTKLGTTTASRVLETSGTGAIQASAVTATEIAKLDGVTASTAELNLVDGSVSGPLSHRNAIINGDFRIMQAAQNGNNGSVAINNPMTGALNSHRTYNNDDSYCLDRWLCLSDGNDTIDISQGTVAGTPTPNAKCIVLDVETVNRKFGLAQIIENQNCDHLINNEVTLSFQAKVTTSTSKLDNFKAAVLSWTGTIDAVTSDFVNAWGAEGTNPTLVSNWFYESVPANLNITTSFAKYSITCTPNESNAKNLAVFIWSDVTDTTAGHLFNLTDVQLELGATATPFERRSSQEQLADCMRYMQYPHYKNSDGLCAPPGTVVSHNGSSTFGMYTFPVAMRVAPSGGVNNATNWWRVTGDNSGHDASSMSFAVPTTVMIKIQVTCPNSTQGKGYILTSNNNNTQIEFNAEM